MDTGGTEVILDEFSTWKLDALKAYLTKRGVTKDGTKAELAALCFSVHTLKTPLIKSQEDVIKENELSYTNILKSVDISDPFKIFDNWEEEKTGMGKWPPIFLSDILTFLLTVDPDQAKYQLTNYKIGKAYEYFQCNWLKEVFINSLTPASPYCLLRSKCCPSQRLNEEPHSLWVCVIKDTGNVKAAYCTCTAGLGQSCNHVAALLFRVEAANKLGVSACTSLKSVWDVPADGKMVTPQELATIKIVKSTHSKSLASRPLVSIDKHKYEPLMEKKSKKEVLHCLTEGLRNALPNACLYKGTDISHNLVACGLEHKKTVEKNAAPSSFTVVKFSAEAIVKQMNSEKKDVFPPITPEDVATIANATVGQFKNQNWHNIRSGRITSTQFYSIFTKSVSASKGRNVNYLPEVSCVMGYKTLNPNIKSLKFGREMEPIARIKYLKKYENDGHTNICSQECGIYLDIDNPYLGASPDLLMSCSCCGHGLAEFKCSTIEKCTKCTTVCVC